MIEMTIDILDGSAIALYFGKIELPKGVQINEQLLHPSNNPLVCSSLDSLQPVLFARTSRVGRRSGELVIRELEQHNFGMHQLRP